MSERSLKRTIDVTVCDFCDKDINNRHSEDWVHIIREQQLYHQPSGKEKWLRFVWPSKVTFTAIRYDFHAECFDKMVKAACILPNPEKEVRG